MSRLTLLWFFLNAVVFGLRRSETRAALRGALNSDQLWLRRLASYILTTLGADALKVPGVLRQGLADRDDVVRKNTALALKRLGAQASSFLLRALADRDQRVRRASVVILGLSQTRDVSQQWALAQALNDSDVGVRKAAVWALLRQAKGRMRARPRSTAVKQLSSARVRSRAYKTTARRRRSQRRRAHTGPRNGLDCPAKTAEQPSQSAWAQSAWTHSAWTGAYAWMTLLKPAFSPPAKTLRVSTIKEACF